MPCCFRRAVELSELETAPLIGTLRAASASMKKFTVEPVPTPMTSLSGM